MAKLPNGDRAEVDPQKLEGYVLNPDHRVGRHKARVFSAALGLSVDGADSLAAALRAAATSEEATLLRRDPYGAHYALSFTMTYGARSAIVRSLWTIRSSEDFPRFVSAFVARDTNG